MSADQHQRVDLGQAQSTGSPETHQTAPRSLTFARARLLVLLTVLAAAAVFFWLRTHRAEDTTIPADVATRAADIQRSLTAQPADQPPPAPAPAQRDTPQGPGRPRSAH